MSPDLAGVIEEAARELSICNSCRYCEGYCAVFPSLERRTLLGDGDISQIANLCHDCRACFDACMYTEPHEFAVNLPRALSAVRVADYRRYVWPAKLPRVIAGWRGASAAAAAVVLVLLLASAAHAGLSRLAVTESGPASPYEIISYPALLLIILLPAIFALAVLIAAAVRYWHVVADPRQHPGIRTVATSLAYAAGLRYLRGGGAECNYPEDETPSAARRRLHYLVSSGFALCFVSTAAAGISQDLLGDQPPYPWLSVPVISGVLGGVGLAAGCGGLMLLKRRSSAVTSLKAMTVQDYGLLVALLCLAVTGMATLLVRTTPAFGSVFLLHLACVILSILAAPYSKFSHVVFRTMAIVQDTTERASAARPKVR